MAKTMSLTQIYNILEAINVITELDAIELVNSDVLELQLFILHALRCI
jgi:hypothetical protein